MEEGKDEVRDGGNRGFGGIVKVFLYFDTWEALTLFCQYRSRY